MPARSGPPPAPRCLAAILMPPIGVICGIWKPRKNERSRSLAEFADPRHVTIFLELSSSPETAEFNQMRDDGASSKI